MANDYTIRFANEVYQLLPPAWPGERGGTVVVERRADGTVKVRFKGRYLAYRTCPPPTKAAATTTTKEEDGTGAPPPTPRSLAPGPIPAGGGGKGDGDGDAKGRADESARPPAAVHRPAGRSGRTPAEPCPPGGGSCGTGPKAHRPASNHPWR